MPLLPEGFHDTPWFKAAAIYWDANEAKGAAVRSTRFMNKYKQDIIDLNMNYSTPTTSMVLDDGEYEIITNPNLNITI